jgi:hypothetical protein
MAMVDWGGATGLPFSSTYTTRCTVSTVTIVEGVAAAAAALAAAFCWSLSPSARANVPMVPRNPDVARPVASTRPAAAA